MAVFVGGTDWDIINTNVDSSGYTEITYPKPVKSFFHKSRNDVVLFLKRRTSSSSSLKIVPGDKPHLEIILTDASAASASLGFITTEGGADTVETVVIL